VTHQPSLLEKNYFLLRRLHSLTGIVPVGVFLIFHLTTNGSVLWGLLDYRKAEYGHAGIATFQHEVNFIHNLPALLLMEVFVIWLPLAFHSLLGIYYAMSGKSNVSRYAYQDNWRYTWQRITAYIGLIFIFWHVATMRWGWTSLIPANFGKEPAEYIAWEAAHAGSSMALILQGSKEGLTTWGLLTIAAYAIGTAAMVFHFANGLWTAAITWGLTVSGAAQKRWGWVCLGLGAGLMVLGLGSIAKFSTINYAEARNTEIKFRAAELAEPGAEKTTEKGGKPVSMDASGAPGGAVVTDR
jgi:succinate dehydrogenase / fumarate reductase cytochrome b subunit